MSQPPASPYPWMDFHGDEPPWVDADAEWCGQCDDPDVCPACGGPSISTRGEAMFIEMVDPQGQLLREIADKRMKRDDVALTYAFALRQQSEVDFAVVNRAIMDRWSIAALRYIKDKAWRLARDPA